MSMDEILRLIGEKLVLVRQLAEAAEKQRRALKAHAGGRAVAAATREVEAVFQRMEAVERAPHFWRGSTRRAYRRR